MAFPSDVLEQIQDGKSFLSALDALDTENLSKGCEDCTIKNYYCLSMILYSLSLKVELDQYDDYAKALIIKMLIIIGEFSVQIPPSVNAGNNQSAELGGTVIFTAVGTPGSSAIVSYLWTQLSGTPATLTNANTSVLSVSNYSVGNSVFKVTVTDANGLKGSDTVQLTGQVASIVGYWWLSDEGDAPLTQSEILTKNAFSFANGGNMTVVFTGVVYKILNIAYPNSQATRTEYSNPNNPDDFGDVGGGSNLLGSAITTGIFKQHNGNYVVNGNRTLTFST